VSKKVLIIDDEEEVRELFQKKLNASGYVALSSETGEAGLESARKESPDLIILDIRLPGIDGTEVFRILKEDPSTQHIPVIFVTAVDAPRKIVQQFERGAENYLLKPVSPKALLGEVEEILVGR